MIYWVAIVIACSTPSALDCNAIMKPTPFATEAKCREDVQMAIRYFYEKGIYAKAGCQKIQIGEFNA